MSRTVESGRFKETFGNALEIRPHDDHVRGRNQERENESPETFIEFQVGDHKVEGHHPAGEEHREGKEEGDGRLEHDILLCHEVGTDCREDEVEDRADDDHDDGVLKACNDLLVLEDQFKSLDIRLERPKEQAVMGDEQIAVTQRSKENIKDRIDSQEAKEAEESDIQVVEDVFPCRTFDEILTIAHEVLLTKDLFLRLAD